MGTEIEKKYRLERGGEADLRRRLAEVGTAERGGEVFEENTVYVGPGLDRGQSLLRLRRAGGRSVLTYKERQDSGSAIKRRREEETEVGDASVVAAIFEALGYSPAIVYEKRRTTWLVAGTEVVIDELPFGLFVEIEGEEAAIGGAEELLGLAGAEAEHASYPELTRRHGRNVGGIIEARFAPAPPAAGGPTPA